MYYQLSPARLPMCPVTLHALLHIPDGIIDSGPVWVSWAFPIERFCGTLSPVVKSRRFPYASIDRHLTETAQLSQIKLTHNLTAELSLRKAKGSTPGAYADLVTCAYTFEKLVNIVATELFEADPTCVLLPPCRDTAITASLLQNIKVCLATRFDFPNLSRATPLLARASIHQYGKVRRLDGGDTMHASTLVSTSNDRRDATYVRVSVQSLLSKREFKFF